MFDVRISRKSEKFFRKCDIKLKERLEAVFEKLEQEPVPVKDYDVKKISGGEYSKYRIRLSSFRIIYAVHWAEKIIRIIKIERRDESTYN